MSKRQPLVRDPEIVRGLLIYISQAGSETMSAEQPTHPEHSRELISYHLSIMYQHGLFNGSKLADDSWSVSTLTWEGQDFLAAAQDETIWSKAKTQAGSAFGALTLGALKELLNSIVRSQVGLG